MCQEEEEEAAAAASQQLPNQLDEPRRLSNGNIGPVGGAIPRYHNQTRAVEPGLTRQFASSSAIMLSYLATLNLKR